MDTKNGKTQPNSTGIDRKHTMFAFKIFGDFGATIAIPVVFFAWLGNKMDAKYDTSPWLLILGFVLAAVISGASIYRKAQRLGKEFQDL